MTKQEKSVLLSKYEKFKGYSSNLFNNEEWTEFDAFCKGCNLAGNMIKDKQYQFYEFSQLFHEILKDCIEYESLEFLFPIISNELEKFENSKYNDESRGEYD
jgi:hypothetical protein